METYVLKVTVDAALPAVSCTCVSMIRLVLSGFSAGACSQGLMTFLNQQTMIILIACVAILWWTTDYTTCDTEDSKANPLPHDSLVQDSIGKGTEGHQDEETYTSVKPKMASKGNSNDEIKQQRIKGMCVFSNGGTEYLHACTCAMLSVFLL